MTNSKSSTSTLIRNAVIAGGTIYLLFAHALPAVSDMHLNTADQSEQSSLIEEGEPEGDMVPVSTSTSTSSTSTAFIPGSQGEGVYQELSSSCGKGKRRGNKRRGRRGGRRGRGGMCGQGRGGGGMGRPGGGGCQGGGCSGGGF